jgi:putative transposase
MAFPTLSGCTIASISAIEISKIYSLNAVLPSAAKRFLRRRLRSHGGEPRKIVTDKLRSYGVAHREIMPDVIHDNSQYANNRAEQSHEATRVRERGMRKFKSVTQARRCLAAYAAVSNLFIHGRHRVGAQHYRDLRVGAFEEWSRTVARAARRRPTVNLHLVQSLEVQILPLSEGWEC